MLEEEKDEKDFNFFNEETDKTESTTKVVENDKYIEGYQRSIQIGRKDI